MDEPTAALDPKSRGQIIDFLAAERGGKRTIVTATHDLDIIEDIADHSFVFQNGNVVAQGTPQQILSDAELLQRTNLVHSHRHVHGGQIHSHPHTHSHTHDQ